MTLIKTFSGGCYPVTTRANIDDFVFCIAIDGYIKAFSKSRVGPTFSYMIESSGAEPSGLLARRSPFHAPPRRISPICRDEWRVAWGPRGRVLLTAVRDDNFLVRTLFMHP